MKHLLKLLAVGTLGFVLGGCMYPNGRPDYTASGALAGGATGAVIGSMARHPGPGALVGGVIGALAGGIIGHGLDQAQEARLRDSYPRTYRRIQEGGQMSIGDVEALTRAGVGADLIISQIHASHSVFRLNSNDIIALKDAGVSEDVIDAMINSRTTAVVDVPDAPPPPYPEYRPICPGPGYIWYSGEWIWVTDRWSWRPGYWYHPRHHFYGRAAG